MVAVGRCVGMRMRHLRRRFVPRAPRRGGLCRHASGQEQVTKIMSYFKEQVYFARVGKSIGIREECRAGRWLSAYLAR